MSGHVERTIRIIDDAEAAPNQVAYWRMRSPAERLAETLRLHREGNELFRRGGPGFVYVIRTRDVDDPR